MRDTMGSRREIAEQSHGLVFVLWLIGLLPHGLYWGGDFNDVLASTEKRGGKPQPSSLISGFAESK
ncbi:hypothetical protein Sjap_011238 [Stephania japonica]|uniref:Uncharacterized protein n=1 Tax=Stephania japonica TaxID=461633 RepID=A0AAP0P7X7_9MAGN